MIHQLKTTLLVLTTASFAAAEDWRPLWPGEAPGAARPAPGTETVGVGGRYAHIERPEYRLYPAPVGSRDGRGVVIFPGGGYRILAMNHEGHDYAEWLNRRGISAMVVKYRVSGDPEHGYRDPVPFLDARRAIRTMRSLAEELDLESVGVMGSSAGGHLASLCATKFDAAPKAETADAIDALSCRPDFAVLVYPVISMGPLGHAGSRRRLIGPDPGPEMVEALSTDRQVTGDTPPCFLVTTADDPVDCRNSLRFAAACKEHEVPVALHLFETGGHGYGLGGKGSVSGWPRLLEEWLERRE